MGEIADAMLDGTLCEACGEYIGSDAGFPQYCSPECAASRGQAAVPVPRPPAMVERRLPAHAIVICTCGRRVKAQGFHQHWQDKHGAD